MSDSKIKLEIVCGNIESVITAQENGADRIELCDNLAEGGTTPSYGMIELARKKLLIGLFVIIRPRGGDFLYSDNEFEIMKQDVEICKRLKADSVVLGLLNADGSVDKVRTKELVNLAKPMSVTFHRAFDMTGDPLKALEDIIDCGCNRILTSGLKPTAREGAKMISQLVKLSAGRIIILPGGGIRPDNVAELIKTTSASEIHSSAKSIRSSMMNYKSDSVKMGASANDEYRISIADAATIQNIKKIISNF